MELAADGSTHEVGPSIRSCSTALETTNYPKHPKELQPKLRAKAKQPGYNGRVSGVPQVPDGRDSEAELTGTYGGHSEYCQSGMGQASRRAEEGLRVAR